jgi:hypothetical protein
MRRVFRTINLLCEDFLHVSSGFSTNAIKSILSSRSAATNFEDKSLIFCNFPSHQEPNNAESWFKGFAGIFTLLAGNRLIRWIASVNKT